jgi:general secretion pathway protein G
MNCYPLFNCRVAHSVPFSNNLNRNIWVRGFTLIEIMIVTAIIGTLSAVAVPNYLKYRTKGRIALVMSDIRIIEKQIMCYWVDTGELPDGLSVLPNGNIRDPWGNPYQYLKIDGVTDPGVDNPSDDLRPTDGVNPSDCRPTAEDNPSDSHPTAQDNPSDDIDAGVLGKVRRDHFLVPVNTDFDLYSLGEDGKSQSPFTAAASQDDIVRADNGRFVGLVSDY